MGYLVAGVGNVYIDIGHVMGTIIATIIVKKIYQMMQYVVCTLIIALKDVSYSVCFFLILQSMYTLQILLRLLSSNNLFYLMKAL